MMNAIEIKKMYLEFMEKRGWPIRKSGKLVDSTFPHCFTISGAVDWFNRKLTNDPLSKEGYAYWVRCFRHYDTPDKTHLPFFWMLLDVSWDLYPREKAIWDNFAFFKELGLDPNKLQITCWAGGKVYGKGINLAADVEKTCSGPEFEKMQKEGLFIPRDEEEIMGVRKRYNLQGDFFIFVGQNRQVKNIQFLIKVFEEVKKVQKDISLVIVGRGYQIINSDAVRVLGRVPDKELSALYSDARAFVTASLYEGFGLPIVEAMACKCAVISSKVGALPEVVDEAGFLLQQNSQAEYIEAILLLAQDRQVRLDLANKGLERSKKFSWNRFTKDIVGQI